LTGCASEPSSTEGLATALADESAVTRGDALMDLGDRALEKGNLEGAAALYDQSARVDPQAASRWARLADVMARQSRWIEAEQAYAKARRLTKDDAGGTLALGHGRSLLTLDRPAEAAEAFREAFAQGGAGVSALNGLGVALDQMGRHAEAREAYDKALEQEPDNPKVGNNKALSLALSGDLSDARALMSEVAAQQPEDTRAALNLALILGMEGREAEAAEITRRHMPEVEVLENLAFYEGLRRMETGERTRAILRAARGQPVTPGLSAK
jgi:Flp pilus assembly protein TadD